jgi:hypothetical protein
MALGDLTAAWARAEPKREAEVRRQAGSFHSSHVVVPRLGVKAQSLRWEDFSVSRVEWTGPLDALESFGRLSRIEAGLLWTPSLALVPIISSTESFLGLLSPQADVDDLLAVEREM